MAGFQRRQNRGPSHFARPDSGFSTSGPLEGGRSREDIFGRKDSIEDFQNQYENRNTLSLAELMRGFGGGGGGGGGGGRPDINVIDLDPFKNKELDAMRELLRVQTGAQRTELTGDRSRVGNAFQRFEALRNKQLTDDLRTNRGSAQRRGFLDSGIFTRDVAEKRNVATGDISSEDVRSSALVDALSRQIGGSFDYLGRGTQDYGVGTLETLRSAQEASNTADIERSYLNARISQGGRG